MSGPGGECPVRAGLSGCLGNVDTVNPVDGVIPGLVPARAAIPMGVRKRLDNVAPGTRVSLDIPAIRFVSYLAVMTWLLPSGLRMWSRVLAGPSGSG
ncbi:MAG: hypothetical protein OXE86_10980 [Alphaproteobacteria bacterium]|nr:hypothetical protein [Alphaproteobacteria bacterium]